MHAGVTLSRWPRILPPLLSAVIAILFIGLLLSRCLTQMAQKDAEAAKIEEYIEKSVRPSYLAEQISTHANTTLAGFTTLSDTPTMNSNTVTLYYQDLFLR